MDHTTLPLSKLKPCKRCAGKMVPIFYTVELRIATIDKQDTDEVLGLNKMFGGRALGLAEVFAPSEPIKIQKEPAGEYHLCAECHIELLTWLEAGE